MHSEQANREKGFLMKIRYVILEREDQVRYELENMLWIHKVFECAGEFSDIIKASDFIEENRVDVVFADYATGDARHSGDASFMCNFWAQRFPDMMTILYSRDQMDVYTALRQGCFDFFTIPVNPEELLRVVNRIRYQFELLQYKVQSRNRILLIKTKTGYQLIERDSILFVERMNRKNRLITANGEEIILANYTMDELENLLSVCGFYRCYQSFIVNLEKVTSIHVNGEKKVYTLQFDGYDGEIILSREKYAHILDVLKEKYAKVSL